MRIKRGGNKGRKMNEGMIAGEETMKAKSRM
jgi:hypothetical protein